MNALASLLQVASILPLLLVPLVLILAVWFRARYVAAVVRLQRTIAVQSAAPGAAMATAAPLSSSSCELAAFPPHQLASAIDVRRADAVPLEVALTPALAVRRRLVATSAVMGALYWLWLLIVLYSPALSPLANARDSSSFLLALRLFFWMASDPLTGPRGGVVAAMTISFIVAPPVLAWLLQTGWRRRTFWIVLVCWLGSFVAGRLMLGATPTEGLGFAIGALLLLGASALFVSPAVRGAGPPLLAASIAGVAAMCPLLAIGFVLDPETGIVDWFTGWADVVVGSTILAGSVALGIWTGRRALTRIAHRYVEKRFSDQQLALAAFWGFATLFVVALDAKLSIEMILSPLITVATIIVVPVGWMVWRQALRMTTRLATTSAGRTSRPLLILRVFKGSRRSEEFMDRLLARWRFVAPVVLIGGPDLAGGFMDPDEFLAWFRRRLGERFITDVADVAARIESLDQDTDPDGRFRVSELFCADSTWQSCVVSLMPLAGAVLLDLRDYTGAHRGTRFELVELLRRGDLRRVVVLTDEAGEAPRVRAALDDAWRDAGGRDDGSPPALVTVVQVLENSDAEMRGLLHALGGAAMALG